jgi:cytoskeletal protein CcmA (bactofilin family)
MAIWKDQSTATTTVPERPVAAPVSAPVEPAAGLNRARMAEVASREAHSAAAAAVGESIIAPELTIEGKIEGNGNVRIAGRFKGDVNIQGNLTIEPRAHLTGQVTAKVIVVSGELQGNVLGADRVEILDSGAINGDVKAGAVTVATGARMRGQVEFGWKDKG